MESNKVPSKEADEKARILMTLLKGMTIYDVKGVLEIITRNVECCANGTVYEALEIHSHHKVIKP